MHDKLKIWEEAESDDEAQEDDLNYEADYLSDVTDKFLEKVDFPKNLDVTIEAASGIKNRLYKLGYFLASYNFLEERNKIIKLAHGSVLEEAKTLRAKLKKEIENLLSDEYHSHFVSWNYETDFKSEAINIGFSNLEKDFAQLMHEGLIALDDLNIDEALEVLWAASGLTPDGHHDFDENLISLDLYLYVDLNRQADQPGGREVLEVRGEMAKKFSEWIEYREPNFENLEDLSLEGFIDVIVENYPNLDRAVDDIYDEWEGFLDKLSTEDKPLAETMEFSGLPSYGESYVPDEIPEYTDISSPKYHENEEPVGDIEEFLYNKDPDINI